MSAPTYSVVAVRHGYAASDRYYRDIFNVLLHEIGERQAALAATALAGRDIVHLAASPQARAQQTALALQETLARRGSDLKLHVSAALKEAGNRMEHKLPTALPQTALIGIAKYGLEFLTDFTRPGWRAPAEAHQAMGDRQWRAIRQAATAARETGRPNATAVVFSHDFPMKMAVLRARGELATDATTPRWNRPLWTLRASARLPIPNCAMIEYVFTNDQLVQINQLADPPGMKQLRAKASKHEHGPAMAQLRSAHRDAVSRAFAKEFVEKARWRTDWHRDHRLALADRHPMVVLARVAAQRAGDYLRDRASFASWDPNPPHSLGDACPEPANGPEIRARLEAVTGEPAPRRFILSASG